MNLDRMLPAERRARLLQELTERGAIHITTLCRQLGVSPMTLHRDIDELVRQGYARKARGGAVVSGSWSSRSKAASSPSSTALEAANRCGVCAKPAGGRHTFVVQYEDAGSKQACCAHCGLLLLGEGVATAMASDFLFGHSINARTASYVVNPDLVVCCAPAVLPFGQPQDAERFRRGFGGSVMTLDEALAWLRAEMTLHRAAVS